MKKHLKIQTSLARFLLLPALVISNVGWSNGENDLPKPELPSAPAPVASAPPVAPPSHPQVHSRLSAKELKAAAKAKSKKFWRRARQCAFSVIWGAALAGGVYFWGVPAVQDYFQARQQQADVAYSESLLPKLLHTYGGNSQLIEADMRRVAVYLIPRMTWDQVYRVLLEVDEDGGQISRYAEELGLPADLLHDSRTWGIYFRANPDMGAIGKLLARALTLDWLRYRDELGPAFASEVTLQDLLIRQMEKGAEEG